MLQKKNEMQIIYLYCLVCLGAGVAVFCPIFMSDVFKPHIKFSGISFAYNLAYAIAGGFTPQLIAYLHIKACRAVGGFDLYAPSAYIFLICLVALLTSALMAKIYRVNNNPHIKKG